MSANLEDAQKQPTLEKWFICKRSTGICEIVNINSGSKAELTDAIETWGAFNSQGEAIAKRVGLIRAGKCQPI